MTFPADILAQAESVLAAARAQGLRIATAESCTGGLVAGALTEIAGSSDVVECGFVTYANAAKTALLGVSPAWLDDPNVGAVSEVVARAMAEGALRAAPIDLAVGITGIAGPGGGSAHKPVGLVHFGCARAGRPTLHERHVFAGNRSEIRLAAVRVALAMIAKQIA
ncbi:MAG TPA: CinA family protein [Alphaproteobacteria bacterium]|nr:CinA family protein [Alphaproteobacteria bacterium]